MYNASLIPHGRTYLWAWVLPTQTRSPLAFPSGGWATFPMCGTVPHTLIDSVQTAHTVDVLLTNTTLEMIQQAQINQEILTCFSVVESALNWISKHQEALVTHQQLTCDPGFAKLCITRLPWNSNQYSWSDIQYHRRGASSTNLKGQIDKLQLELHSSYRTFNA